MNEKKVGLSAKVRDSIALLYESSWLPILMRLYYTLDQTPILYIQTCTDTVGTLVFRSSLDARRSYP